MSRLTREFFVKQTCELLTQQGRIDFSLSDVLRLCGAQKGSLYHFFPNGKGELVAAAVDLLSDLAYEHAQFVLETQATPGDAVHKFVTDTANYLESPDAVAMPFSAIATLTNEDSEEVKLACQRALKRLESAFCQGLKASGLETKEAKSLASFFVTTIEGAFLMSRAVETSTPLRNAAKHLRELVK